MNFRPQNLHFSHLFLLILTLKFVQQIEDMGIFFTFVNSINSNNCSH